MRIVFATNNQGKLGEGREIVGPSGVELASLQDILRENPSLSSYVEPEEGESSYADNARLKAECCHNWCGLPSVGDDSGLEVDALNGAPGITSARYAGVGCTAAMNKEKLLTALESIQNRSARIRCVLCYVDGEGKLAFFEGLLECEIATHERGSGGFGYDRLLEVPGTGKTLAELKDSGIDVKTHRALAFEKLLYALRRT